MRQGRHAEESAAAGVGSKALQVQAAREWRRQAASKRSGCTSCAAAACLARTQEAGAPKRGRVAHRKQPEAEEQAVPTAAKKANEKPKATPAASAEAADLRFSRVELGPGALAPATLFACMSAVARCHINAPSLQDLA